MADKLNIETTLALNQLDIFVKAHYDKNMEQSFIVFDADEKLEAIEEYLN